MKGEKTLASGNVARWTLERGATNFGVQATFRTTPSPADAEEFAAFAQSLVPGAVPSGAFVGLGDAGRRAAKAAFYGALGRSTN